MAVNNFVDEADTTRRDPFQLVLQLALFSLLL